MKRLITLPLVIVLFVMIGCTSKYYQVDKDVPLTFLKSSTKEDHGRAYFDLFGTLDKEFCSVYENHDGLYHILYNRYADYYMVMGITTKIIDDGLQSTKEAIDKYGLQKVILHKDEKGCYGVSSLQHYAIRGFLQDDGLVIEYTKDPKIYAMMRSKMEAEDALAKKVEEYIANTLPNEKLQGAKYMAGLIWQDELFNQREKPMNFKEAQHYCKNLTLFNSKQWRLPTLEEYKRLGANGLRNFTYNNKKDYFTSTTGCSYSSIIGSASGSYCVYLVQMAGYDANIRLDIGEEHIRYRNSVRCVLDPKVYAMQKLKGNTQRLARRDAFYSVDEFTTMKVISGKVLIAQDAMYCDDEKSTKPCLGIAVLDYYDGSAYERVPAKVILPDKKKTLTTAWGIYSNNFFDYDVNMGIATLPTKNFEKRVKLNESETILRIVKDVKNPTDYMDVKIVKDDAKKARLLSMAQSNNYRQINLRGGLVESVMKKVSDSLNTFMKDMAKVDMSQVPTASNTPNASNQSKQEIGLKKFACTFAYSGLSSMEMSVIGDRLTLYAKDRSSAEKKGREMLNQRNKNKLKVSTISCH